MTCWIPFDYTATGRSRRIGIQVGPGRFGGHAVTGNMLVRVDVGSTIHRQNVLGLSLGPLLLADGDRCWFKRWSVVPL